MRGSPRKLIRGFIWASAQRLRYYLIGLCIVLTKIGGDKPGAVHQWKNTRRLVAARYYRDKVDTHSLLVSSSWMRECLSIFNEGAVRKKHGREWMEKRLKHPSCMWAQGSISSVQPIELIPIYFSAKLCLSVEFGPQSQHGPLIALQRKHLRS